MVSDHVCNPQLSYTEPNPPRQLKTSQQVWKLALTWTPDQPGYRDLLCTKANSASYPQQDGKWVVAYLMWNHSVADIEAMVCLLAAPWVIWSLQVSVNAGNSHIMAMAT